MILDFLILSIGLGTGLAMDAFSVCIANGLKEPNMSRSRHMKMAGIYAFFQFAMPMIGWLCVHTIQKAFVSFQKCIPWIALILLLYIGIQMIVEGIKERKNCCEQIETDSDNKERCLSNKTLFIQGIATSIDALSVGFAIANYSALEAFGSSIIIAVVTFIICLLGVKLGKICGCRLQQYANYLGGTILIIIGLEIFIRSFI
ncbi:MAG: manganese efflux pump MntP family protein [Butyrivibrio sp.]|nr:manganese efflux pump MntP family protein [Butyrivibrio sp.]MCR5772588.1 manganese efflux pump MntP family protein [Butyrivibrio sp.]